MTANLRSLLRNADPIPQEAPLPDTTREQLRLTILRGATTGSPTRPSNARRTIAAAAGVMAVLVTMVAYGLWLRTTPVFAAVRFEVRLAEDHPVQGLVVAQVPGSDGVLYLHPEIVVSNDDIAQSWVVPDGPDGYSVAVQFQPSGADRMKQATALHVGRPVAILIDGRVVMAPIVRAPIGDSAVITGHFSQAEAERVAEGMRLQ